MDYKIELGDLTKKTPHRVSIEDTVAKYKFDYVAALAEVGVELRKFSPRRPEANTLGEDATDNQIDDHYSVQITKDASWNNKEIYPLQMALIDFDISTMAKRQLFYNPEIVTEARLEIVAWATYCHLKAHHDGGQLYEIVCKSKDAPRSEAAELVTLNFTVEPDLPCSHLEEDRQFAQAMFALHYEAEGRVIKTYQRRSAIANGVEAREKWEGDCFRALADVGYQVEYADLPYIVEHLPCKDGELCTNDWIENNYGTCKGKLIISNWALRNRPELIHMIAWMCVYHNLEGGHKKDDCPWMQPYQADRTFMSQGRSYARQVDQDTNAYSRGGICSQAEFGRAFTLGADFNAGTNGSLYIETDEFFEEWFDRLEADYKIKSTANKK